MRRDKCARRRGLLPALWLIGSWLFCAPAFAQDAAEFSRRLAAPDVATRREAAYQLGQRNAPAKEALPALIKALSDSDKQVWSFAITAIANLGPAAEEAIPVLIDGLEMRKARGFRDRDKRQSLTRAAFALTRIGPAAIPPLLKALEAADPTIRQGAARALGEMGAAAGDAIPALIGNLTHNEADVRGEAAEALGAIGAAAVKPLTDLLTSSDARLRASAATTLGHIGPGAKEAAPLLLQLTENESEPGVRSALLTAISKVGADPERAVAFLVKGITDDNEQVRHAAINALVPMRAGRKFALPALAALLKDPNSTTPSRAARALGRIGPDAAPAIPALIEAARTSPGDPAFGNALAQIGPAALPALLNALREGSPADSERLVGLLQGFGSQGVPVLIEALKSPSSQVRVAAARALSGMGSDARPAIDPLFAHAADSEASVRATTLRVLVILKAEPQKLQPLLEAALKDSAPEVRRAGAAGLAASGNVDALGVDGLLELLGDETPATRLVAVEALGSMGPKAEPAVAQLAERLSDPALQAAAAVALGKIGPAAAPAVPRLIEIGKQGGLDLRVGALSALTAIGREASTALPMLYEALHNSEADVRGTAALAIASIETDETKAIAALTPGLTDETGRVRRPTALALAKFGDRARSATPAILAMLERDMDRATALQALKVIGVRSVPGLSRALAVKDPAVRMFVCEQLGALGAEAQEAIPKLKELLSGQPAKVQDAARSALARIEPPQ